MVIEARGTIYARCASTRAPRRLAAFVAVMLVLALVCGGAYAQPVPKRGGILEFAVLVEPVNYDCYANTSFAFLHPIAPHYSTLLKFDAADYPQDCRRLGPIVERITRPDDLYLQAVAERLVP